MIYLFLDTETTGVDKENDMIISFSYKICDDDFKEIEHGIIEMNPFTSLEEAKSEKYAKALEVNGYKPEQIMEFMSASVGMAKVAEVYKRALGYNGGWWPKIVGYNSNAFDIPMIRNNAKRFGAILPEVGEQHIDVYQLVLALDVMGKIPQKRNELGKPMKNKLFESVARLNIEADEDKFHDASYDTEMTYQIFMKLKQTVTINI